MRTPSPKSRFSILIASLAAMLFTDAALAAPRLMQGPMVGAVTQNTAKIWARVAGEHELSFRYSETPTFHEATTTEAILATAANDHCVEIELSGLKAGSFYYYQTILDGQPLDNPAEREGYPLLTAPPSDRPVEFTIAFGSGAQVDTDGLQAIWLQVQNARPHSFFWLGENESLVGLEPEFQAEQYRKQRSVPFLQPLLRSIPQLATWNASAATEPRSFETFKRYWANPAYGTDATPGSYFKHSYGGVDFLFLDTFTYRDIDKETMLGKGQLEWLKSQLADSDARFKILLSGSSWTNKADANANSWLAFDSERNDLFSFIKESEIEGVALISGDDDEAEIKAIPMSKDGGYDLYELVSSPLAQEPRPAYDEFSDTAIAIEEPYYNSMNFGMITFDMSGEDPTMSVEIINVFGESVFNTFEVKASELTNGIASWKSKAPPETVAYIEAQAAEKAAN